MGFYTPLSYSSSAVGPKQWQLPVPSLKVALGIHKWFHLSIFIPRFSALDSDDDLIGLFMTFDNIEHQVFLFFLVVEALCTKIKYLIQNAELIKNQKRNLNSEGSD